MERLVQRAYAVAFERIGKELIERQGGSEVDVDELLEGLSQAFNAAVDAVWPKYGQRLADASDPAVVEAILDEMFAEAAVAIRSVHFDG